MAFKRPRGKFQPKVQELDGAIFVMGSNKGSLADRLIGFPKKWLRDENIVIIQGGEKQTSERLFNNITGSFLSPKNLADFGIELAELNPDKPVYAEMNGCFVRINPNDKKEDIIARYREAIEAQQAEFLASPEGRASYKATLEARSGQRIGNSIRRDSERALLKRATEHGKVFPKRLIVSGFKGRGRIEESWKNQILIALQWIEENPDKKPFKNEADTKELESHLFNNTRRIHSGFTHAHLMGQIQEIVEGGFDQFVDRAKRGFPAR